MQRHIKLKLLNQYVTTLEYTFNLAKIYCNALKSYYDISNTSDYLFEMPTQMYLRLPRYRSLNAKTHMNNSATKTWIDLVYYSSLGDHITDVFIYRNTFHQAYAQLEIQYDILKDLIESKCNDNIMCQILCSMKYDTSSCVD